MLGGGEDAHVHTDLTDDHLRRTDIHPRDRAQQLDLCRERGQDRLQTRVEIGDLGLLGVQMVQHPLDLWHRGGLGLLEPALFAVLLLVREGHLSLAAATPPLILLGAWHLSLQHELLHGHPTRSAFVNKLLGYPPPTFIHAP